MKDEFRGRTAVVTGGARGIRYAIPLLEATEASLPVTVDVANAEEVSGALRKTEEELGWADILVNNAGIAGPSKTLWESAIQKNGNGRLI